MNNGGLADDNRYSRFNLTGTFSDLFSPVFPRFNPSFEMSKKQRDRMKDGDQCNVPLEDAVAMDTEVLDAPDYAGKMRGQNVDDVVKDSLNDIVLDSDEEGNEVVSMTSGLSLKKSKRRNGEYASHIEGWNRAAPGYLRGQSRKVCGHSLQLLDSGQRILTDEHCNSEQPGAVHAAAVYQGPLLVSDTGISRIHEMNANCVDEDPKRSTENLTRRSLADDVLDEQKSAPTNCGIMEEAIDVPYVSSHHEFPCITDADSQELGAPSEVNALSFFDQFVSVNNLTLSEKVETRRAKGTKSPPASRAKGVQTLVRRVHSGAKARKPGTFGWAEEQSSENNFVMELDERGDKGSLWQHLEKDESEANMPEIFDIGFETQMAAEAMEALLNAQPPNFSARYEVPEDNIHNSPETGVPGNIKSEVCTRKGMAGANSQITGRQSENQKAANKLHGSISCSSEKQSGSQRKSTSMSTLENNVISREPMTAKGFCENPVNMKKNMNGRSSRVFSQPKKDETCERHNLNEDSKSAEFKNLRGDSRKSSRATKGMKHLSSMSSLERPKDPVSSLKRKRSCKVDFNAPDVHKKVGVGGKRFKFGSDASADVTNFKRTQHNKFASDLNGTTGLLNLDLWNYPKGKRTQRNLAPYSNEGSIPSAWFPVNVEEKKIHDPIHNRNTTNWMGGLAAFTLLKSQSFTERRYSVCSSKQKSDAESLPGSGNCESAITSEQMAPVDLVKGEFSEQPCRIYGEDSVSSVGYSENTKLDAVADDIKTSKISLTDADCKKSGKTVLSKPSLIRELTRLGYSKSLPDILPREARRQHRATVCVLFSQHLDSNIINQQKNVIARLGFSIASCCSVATHFIADRFVRTRNMLEAIALGKPVVTPLWIESCRQANYHIDEKSYILRDARKEREIGFSMPVSLACSNQHPLLKGRRVFITPNIKPDEELIQSLVKAVQGKAIQRVTKDDIISNDVLILSSEGDYTACVPFLKKGAAVYDSELLLNGIVIQKLEYERHRLFTNYDERGGCKAGREKT